MMKLVNVVEGEGSLRWHVNEESGIYFFVF